jgi:hypothetical protein
MNAVLIVGSSEAKINKYDFVVHDSKVIWLDVSMKIANFVHLLNSFNHLLQDLLKRELRRNVLGFKVLLNRIFCIF